MQVFKAYFRIIKRHRLPILIYLIVFVSLSVIISSMMSGLGAPAAFSETKYDIALFNDDAGAALTDGLVQYIGGSAQLVQVGRAAQDVQDALFYGRADGVVTIPQGFAQRFMSGEPGAQVEKIAAAGTPASIYLDFLINRYLNTAALYAKNMPAATQADIAAYVAADLENAADLDYRAGEAAPEDPTPYYFRFFCYSVLAMMMMGVSLAMLSINEANVSNRTLCSPLRPAQMNLQLVLANGVFALAVWAVMCAFTLAVSGRAVWDTGTILLCLNALVFTVVSLFIGILTGKFIKNHGVQAAVTNVVSLGISFVSGVFVSQELLGKTVQTIGSFTPAYWYIRAVDAILGTAVWNAERLRPVWESMLIQLGFAAAILIVLLAASKQRRKAAV
jgi:ABC-2 type transport system permease protein